MTFEEAQLLVRQFRDERDWEQFHDSKDLAIAISLEANELLENYLWTGIELEVPEKLEEVKNELADVLIYCLHLANHLDLDAGDIVLSKMKKNTQKYPAEKARGTARKYTEL